jgi:hypothetical protein
MKKFFAGLIGLLSIVSVANAGTTPTQRNTIFGAELAVPSVSYTCAMPAEGVEVPLRDYAMLMDVSYCEQDPGNNTPELAEQLDWYKTHPVPICPNGSSMDDACLKGSLQAYEEAAMDAWKDYRQAVCKCWKNNPGSTPAEVTARNNCIAAALADFNSWMGTVHTITQAWITANCCVANP